MKSLWWLAYWCILGIPSLLYVLVGTAAAIGACTGSVDHWPCPAFITFGLAIAYVGFLAIVPFTVIGFIWVILKTFGRLRSDH